MQCRIPAICLLSVWVFFCPARAATSSTEKLTNPQPTGTRYKLPDVVDHPLVSSLEPWNATFTGPHSEQRDFYAFHNVMLSNDTLRFYHIGDHLAALPEEPPASLRLSRYELQIDLPVQLVTQDTRYKHPQHCSRWIDKPALLFSGSPWDDNFAEFFTTQLMPMWQTAVMSGLLDPEHAQQLLQLDREALSGQLHDPDSGAPFVLISARPQSFEARWAYLFDYMSRDQWSLQGVHRTCFSRLVVSEDAVLRYLYERVVEMKNASYVEYRADWLARFQRHLFAMEKLHATAHEVDWAMPAAERTLDKPRVTFISRSPRYRRAVLNEQELLDAIASRWDVEVVNTTFGMPLREAISLMQETDLLIGMHGAGMTNAFWMRNGSALLQLLPYGWEVYPGQLIRSAISQDIPLALNGSYFQWVNPYAHNAHFHEGDFETALASWKDMWGSKPSGYQLHPTEQLKLPEGPDTPTFWAYQSTWVDVQSLEPVLDQALSAIGAKPKGHRRTRREM